MEPLSTDALEPIERIAVALIGGAKYLERGNPDVTERFEKLKAEILTCVWEDTGLADSIVALQERPDSSARKKSLLERLRLACLLPDSALLKLADELLHLIPPEDLSACRLEMRGEPNVVAGIDATGMHPLPGGPHTPDILDLPGSTHDVFYSPDLIAERRPGTGDHDLLGDLDESPIAIPSAAPEPPPPECPDETGKVLYNPPERMRVGSPELIEARVANEITESLRAGLRGRGTIVEVDTFLAAVMHLELCGDPGVFEIAANVSRPLLLYRQPKGFAEWRWWVTPKKRGTHELKLRITGQTLTETGMIGDIAFEPIIRTISVTVGAGHVARQAAKWAVPLIASAALGAVVGGYTQKLVGL
jgi:hypothetical protein